MVISHLRFVSDTGDACGCTLVWYGQHVEAIVNKIRVLFYLLIEKIENMLYILEALVS